MRRNRYRRRFAALTVLLLAPALSAWAVSDPFVDEVVAFTAGAHAGFGVERLPGVVLGAPLGAGELQGSTDVLALGEGGSIVLRFDAPAICDRPGPDFIIFENAFHAGSSDGPLFVEVGVVAVSEDGIDFVELPYDAQSFAGLAGKAPVYSNPTNGIDPTDPAVAGGDAFDLAAVGLASARYVRITDPGDAIPDSGSHVVPGNSGGFDLDAIAAIHACDGDAATATPSPTATPKMAVSPTPTQTIPPSPSPTLLSPTTTQTPAITFTEIATVTPAATQTPRPADVDGDGKTDEHDLSLVVRAIFAASFPASADVDRDGRVSAADCSQVVLAMGGAE